jgi:hypothetical protein
MSGVLHSSDCNVYLLGTSTDPWVQRITALNRLEAITSMKRLRARFATLGTNIRHGRFSMALVSLGL